MLTISKPLSATQAQTYHAKEFTAAEQNYWKQGDKIVGEWQGRLADGYGLSGAVDAGHFARLSQGRHPYSAEQLVQHRTGQEYTTADGKTVKPVEHRAGWDATFSAPKSVSLTALVGGDDRVRVAHREAVTIALSELERYTQARIGGNHPAETTGKFIAAKFEHDTARPVDGYAAPQLHTHAVVFNMTERENGSSRALQPQSLFATQQFATAVYQAELMYRLRNLGYEIQPGKSGAPDIKGYSQEYLDASSPRRQQIEEALARSGHSGPEAAQIAAHNTRDRKQIMTPEKVLAAHCQIAAEFGNQADRVVSEARERATRKSQEQVQIPAPDPVQRARESVSYAKARNFEREAVNDERSIMRDALRRGMGDVTYNQIRSNFDRREAAGEFVKVDGRSYRPGQQYTTRETLSAERANIAHMQRGQRSVDPILSRDAAAAHASSRDLLIPAQRRAVEDVLTTADRIYGLQGYAGTGKTTTLMTIREGAQSRGFAVEGFAPTNRAANQLREAGVSAETLHRFLARGETGPTAGDPTNRHLYMVDESSLASTKQVQAFLEKIGPEDRVLLIGDIRQHQGVEAGRPFEQLQDAGMRTALLDQIVRQKDPELLRAVEHLSRNETPTAVALLKEQGRVHEIADRLERIGTIARDYAARPDGTLVISPDNASRLELNQAIRGELRDVGKITGTDRELSVLAQRSELSSADRRWAARYEVGDLLHYSRGSKEHGVLPRSYASVVAVDPKNNLLTVQRDDAQQVTYDPQRLQGISAYRETNRPFAEGDRIQFTANNRELAVSNRELGTIERLQPDSVFVRLDGEQQRAVTFDPNRMRHFDHGYAVTSHSSQGLTADRVLINVEASAHRDLINQRFAYVAVSRAAHEVQLYTDNSGKLALDLSRDVSKTSALEHTVAESKHDNQSIRKEETPMSYRQEHAEGQQPYQATEHLPATMYASTLNRETVSTDIVHVQRDRDAGLEQGDAKRNLEQDHLKRNPEKIPLQVHVDRYAERITESIYIHPALTADQQLIAIQPTAEERRHWEPLVHSLGLEQAESFAWRRELNDIQSYRSEDPKGWLHIDAHGQFFDRGANPISRELALEPLGLSVPLSHGFEQKLNNQVVSNTGLGISL